MRSDVSCQLRVLLKPLKPLNQCFLTVDLLLVTSKVHSLRATGLLDEGGSNGLLGRLNAGSAGRVDSGDKGALLHARGARLPQGDAQSSAGSLGCHCDWFSGVESDIEVNRELSPT